MFSAEATDFFKGGLPPSPYPTELMSLLHPKVFNDFVQHIYHSAEPKKVETRCYEEAEAVFKKFFGRRRYEDYNSYKSSFHQIMTRRRQIARAKQIQMFPELEQIA